MQYLINKITQNKKINLNKFHNFKIKIHNNHFQKKKKIINYKFQNKMKMMIQTYIQIRIIQKNILKIKKLN